MQGESAILRTVMEYAHLKTAKTFLGPDHSDVFERAVKVVTRFMRNFSGMAYVFRRVLSDEYNVAVPLLRKSWYLPRNYYFNYPSEHVGTWHQPRSGWKLELMIRYCTEEQMSRSVSRYELFCIQKEMDEEDILAVGW